MALCPGLPGWASTRKVKPIWILVKPETVSGSGIGWTICKSAPHSRQITTPTPHCSVFYMPDALPAAQPTASKHWRQQSTEGIVPSLHAIIKLYKKCTPLVSNYAPNNRVHFHLKLLRCFKDIAVSVLGSFYSRMQYTWLRMTTHLCMIVRVYKPVREYNTSLTSRTHPSSLALQPDSNQQGNL